MARERTREERLFGAAVLRRSLSLRGEDHERAFRAVYEGVLRDLGVTDEEVADYIRAHEAEVEAALGRGGKPG